MDAEVFSGLAQRLRTNPAFLNAFLADPAREILSSGLLDDDAGDRLKMAVWAQDFLALKSVSG